MDEKKCAIVTGASSGIGFEISKMLLSEDYIVYGIGRDFSKKKEEIEKEKNFHSVQMDLLDTEALESFLNLIKKKEKIELLINGAGVASYGPFDDIRIKDIKEMIRTDLEAPIIMTRLLMKELKDNKGMIINVSSITAEMRDNTHGVVYGSCKAGLTSFSRNLFTEVRKYGVRVVNIEPDLTDTGLYRNATFKTSEAFDERLTANDVAELVRLVIKMREGAVITDLSVRPQKNRIVRKS